MPDKGVVDRRKEPRFKTSQLIRLTVMGEAGFVTPALAVDASGHGMRVLVKQPIAAGALVRIESLHAILVGTVCHCEPAEDGFTVGVELERPLRDLDDLLNPSCRQLLA